MPEAHDVVVIGAGAAGLFAAIRAAERGRRVLVLEKNRKAGVKILMSGGTRCNITHDTDERGIIAAFGPPGKFLHSPLACFGVQDARDFFESEGVPTKVEETGKVFPVSDKATDVLTAILRRLQRSGARLELERPVTTLEQAGAAFQLATPLGDIEAARVLIATGGQSYSGSGTTGDGYRFSQSLGHTIAPPRPALAPITTALPWVAELRGVTLPDVRATVREGDRALGADRGSLLFAHFGLSGPVALNLSRTVSGHSAPASLALAIDLAPAVADADLAEWFKGELATSPRKLVAVLLSARMPRRLAEALLELAGLARDRVAAGLRRDERDRILQHFKRLDFPITGTLGFAKAEVTAGGVALAEVDSRTMQSKIVPNLYIAGEALDLDGPIGGFNFQAAWSTGWLAGCHL